MTRHHLMCARSFRSAARCPHSAVLDPPPPGRPVIPASTRESDPLYVPQAHGPCRNVAPSPAARRNI
jgi:hypothetical protein